MARGSRLAFALIAGSARLAAQRPEDAAPPPAAPVRAEFHFDFAEGLSAAGRIRVPVGTVYSAERGYGYDFGTMDQRSPSFFSVRAPEGNYRVTAVFGDGALPTVTTVRAEAAHLMVADVRTASGEYATRTFEVNVRRPELPAVPKNAPGGDRVHMFLPGEARSRGWDDRLTIELNGPHPGLRSLDLVKDDSVPTLFVAGDSTAADPLRGPGGNWPTQMGQFLRPEIAVCNAADSGETTKSYVTGYRLDKVLSQMKPGDFFLVQFGHNDSKAQWPQSYTDPDTTFKAYLRVYVAETRHRGATLVLVTPMERRANRDTVGRWARAMRAVAAEEGVPLIDQWALSKRLWTALGPRVGEAFVDPTHLSGYGGYLLSKLIVGAMRSDVPALARLVRPDFVPMSPEQPEGPPAYLRQPSGGEVRRDVIYGTAAGEPLRLDVGLQGPGSHPVAVLVHGGGWSAGDKAGGDHPGNSADITPWFGLLNRAGFVWFSINYRMAPRFPWPACAEDVDTAIGWVKAHAADYGGDPARVVLFGHSAGGHLVCYAATHATSANRVRGVVAFAPVTDLVADSERRGGLSPSLQGLFHLPRELDEKVRSLLAAASPVGAVAPGLPPMLLVQGAGDVTVPPAMTDAFARRLRAAGDPVEVMMIPGAPHRLLEWGTFDPDYPERITAWLRREIGGLSPSSP